MLKKRDPETVVVDELLKWLKTHTPVEMAYKLGYESSTTIDQWARRRSIPFYQWKPVLKVVREEAE